MDKQSTIGFVLIGLVLVIWFYMNAPEPQPIDQKKNADSTFVKKDSLEDKKVEPAKEIPVEKAQPADEPTEGPFAADGSPEEIITIETDVAIIELSNKGGSIRRYFLPYKRRAAC